jgi:glycosyltransferase involved in cell wall biosynthesis
VIDVLHIAFGGLGGQRAVVHEMSAQFKRLEISTAVCWYAPPGMFTEGLSDQIDIECKVQKTARVDLAGSRRIGAMVRHLKPTVIFWHSPYAPLAILRCLVSGDTRAILLIEHQTLALRSRMNNVRSAIALPIASRAVFLSEDYKANYPLRWLPLKSIREAVVIPTGIDLSVFSPSPKGNSSPFRVGMMGRMIRSKDFTTLLRSWKRIVSSHVGGHVQLRIAGDGPDRRELESLSRELGVDHTVQFLGHVPARAIPSYLKQLDLYVHATLGETRSTALLQAYGCGLPVVASNVVGVRDFVRHDSDGVLVEPGSATALATVVISLAEDPARRMRLSAVARLRATAEFDAGLMARRYLSLVRDVCVDV